MNTFKNIQQKISTRVDMERVVMKRVLNSMIAALSDEYNKIISHYNISYVDDNYNFRTREGHLCNK